MKNQKGGVSLTATRRFNEDTISSAMKRQFQEKHVKFNSNIKERSTSSFLTQRNSNTPSKGFSFTPHHSSGKQLNALRPKSHIVREEPKPFLIPTMATLGRRSIANEKDSLPPLHHHHRVNNENLQISTPMLNKIEMFKNSNFSLIELMKKSSDNMSETMLRYGAAS
jgi:hypothetical protein